jgi:hypothetical protein
MNILEPIHLECLPEDAIRSLAKLGGECPKEISNFVWEYSGGHPHLAQYILNSLWKKSPGFLDINSDFLYKIINLYYKNYTQNLKSWANYLEHDGIKVYDVLQKQNNWMGEGEISRKAKLPMNLTNQALVYLCFQGLVFMNPNTNKYRAQGELFRNWFILNRKELLLEQDLKKKSSGTKQKHTYEIGSINIIGQKTEVGTINGPVSQQIGLTPSEVKKLFKSIHGKIEKRPKTSDSEKKAITLAVEEIEQSLAQKTPKVKFLQTRFQNLQKMAPDILEVVLATVTSPASGFAIVAKKIAEKVKKNTEAKNK